jgi:hypothetical protein
MVKMEYLKFRVFYEKTILFLKVICLFFQEHLSLVALCL